MVLKPNSKWFERADCWFDLKDPQTLGLLLKPSETSYEYIQ